jgi:hypothetical protein
MNMQEREEQSQLKINAAKKDYKLVLKEKKLLEQRIKELNEMVQSKQSETMNQSKIV